MHICLRIIYASIIFFLSSPPVNGFSSLEYFEKAAQSCQEHNYEQAFDCFAQINKITPDQPTIIYNMAYTLKAIGHMKDAIPLYERAIKINPDLDNAYYGLSQACLATGNYERGWPTFEYRLAYKSARMKQPIDPHTLAGKKVVLLSEFGLGDTIQFIRYAKLLKQLGATVIVQTHQPLVPLFSLCDYIDTVVPEGQKLPAADKYISLLSLPYIFKTTLNTVPADIPYLQADPTLVEQWKEKISDDNNFKIGICWQGKHLDFLDNNPRCTRAVPLAVFEPLSTIPGVSLYSLQKVKGTEQLATLSESFKVRSFDDFDESHGRYMDTAALMMNLDLIVSVDTSIVHLAGALGRPTWILIPYNAAWHWMQERTDSPWYPQNIRLFRCQNIGDWQPVMQSIVKKIEKIKIK